MGNILVGLPCRDEVKTDFMLSLLGLQQHSSFCFSYIKGSCIHDARNKFAADAINGGFDRLVMLDSDMTFDGDLLERLNTDLDTGIDYVSGICFQRHYPTKPCVYTNVSWEMSENGIISTAEPYLDYPKDQLFECGGTGCAAVMIRTSLLKQVWDEFDLPFHPFPRMGEDLSFCWRAKQLGAKLYCDSRIKVGHCGEFCYKEDLYLKGEYQ